MVYADLVSLANTIDRFLNPCLFPAQIQHFVRANYVSPEENKQITSLRGYLTLFQAFLEKFPDKFNSLEGQMRELANGAEDILEYLLLERLKSLSHGREVRELELNKAQPPSRFATLGLKFESQSRKRRKKMGEMMALNDKRTGLRRQKTIKNNMVQLCLSAAPTSLSLHDNCYYPSGKLELELKIVTDKIALMAREVKEIEDSSSNRDVERGGFRSSTTAPLTLKDAMIGFEDYVIDLKDCLCGESSKLQVIPICGMGGVGKTTLARNIYDHPLIVTRFDVRVWVTISQDFSAQRILSSLVESLKEYNTGRLGQGDDEKVHKILMGRRYLVVMDDIWSSEAWDVVRRVFPDDGSGSRVMLTTRLCDVASYPDPYSKICQMSLLSADQSWNLLKKKVFADEDCPEELENIGKEIARSCKGLPLAIVVIAGLVSRVSRNPASWQEIAKNVKSTEHGQIGDILSLSYTHLPQYLRPCFLYMGFFAEDYEINVKKLIRLWVAEGFLKSPIDSENFEKVGEECLEELVKRNLVLVTERKWDGSIKRCSLHDLMRELCIRRAYKIEFFLNLMDCHLGFESSIESTRNLRRVSFDSYISNPSCVFNPVVLYGSTVHSIKLSRYYLVGLNFLKSVRLLRVLDAEPADVQCSLLRDEVYELFHLRYLDIRCNYAIPLDIWKLQNLQTLIIHAEYREVNRGVMEDDLCLKWCMPELRHVYFYGTVLFDDPDETASSLEKLQTLSHVSHRCCTERILKMIPNLKKLKVDCSGGVHHEGAVCLNDLLHLHRLENLQIYAGRLVKSRPKYYNFTFPRMLKKLTLRALRLPWDDITLVGSLPCLQMLKLNECFCVGGTWRTTEGAFPVLEFLLVETSIFNNWITQSSHFPKLKRLLLHNCWDLNEIPNDMGEIPTLELIEVKGVVKTSLMESVELIQQEQEELGNNTLRVLCIAKSSRL